MTKKSIAKEVDNAPDWEARIKIVCQRLCIPDLHSRAGLRQIHKTFPEVYQRLRKSYRDNTQHPGIQGIIATIYARMCNDALLRNKLLKKGFLSQIWPLLDVPPCRVIALRCLVILTHHGGLEARHTIAQQTSRLVKLANDNINEPLITANCIVIIAHTAVSVLQTEGDKVDEKLLRSIGSLETLLQLVDTILRHPETTYETFSHISLLLGSAPEQGRAGFLAHSRSISFLVGCLRSADLHTRVTGMVGAIRLHHSVSEHESGILDTNKMLANLRRECPPVMNDTLMRYGITRAEITIQIKAMNDFSKAVMNCAQDHDLYSLGMKIFEIIGRTEYSLTEGMVQDGDGKPLDLGLPFLWWIDALPHCAQAIREQGHPAERDAANILDIKYFLLRSRREEARNLALEALKSSPGEAFYYYAMTLGADNADGLRWAKKGLRCTGPSLTRYVRFGLLYRAIEHAGLLGLQVLEQASKDERSWKEGFAMLRCAFEDSKTFVEEAPPDTLHMATAILWCTVLTITLKGPDLSPDLGEIQLLLEKQKVADEIKAFIHSAPPAKVALRLGRDTILQYYASAAAEWGPIISRFELQTSDPPSNTADLSQSADNDLSTWLEGTHLEDEGTNQKYCVHTHFKEKDLELYRCSNCSNPSAALKKCMRCAKARYCDASCQKLHWPEHKKVCKKTTEV